MKIQIKKVISVAASILLFLILLALFTYYRYPWNNLATRISDEVAGQTEYELSIGKLAPGAPISINTSSLKLYQKSPRALILSVDELKIKPSVLNLIFGKLKFKFNGSAYGGEFFGRIKDIGKKQYAVEFSSSNLHLNRYDFNPFLVGINSSVRLDGVASFNISGTVDASFKNQNLTGSIKANNFAVLSSKFGEIELPDLRFGNLEIPFEVKGSTLTIKPVSASGESVEARLSGTVNIAKQFSKSHFDIELKLKFKGTLKESLDPLLGWVKEKDTEGFYKIEIRGTPRELKLK